MVSTYGEAPKEGGEGGIGGVGSLSYRDQESWREGVRGDGGEKISTESWARRKSGVGYGLEKGSFYSNSKRLGREGRDPSSTMGGGCCWPWIHCGLVFTRWKGLAIRLALVSVRLPRLSVELE